MVDEDLPSIQPSLNCFTSAQYAGHGQWLGGRDGTAPGTAVAPRLPLLLLCGSVWRATVAAPAAHRCNISTFVCVIGCILRVLTHWLMLVLALLLFLVQGKNNVFATIRGEKGKLHCDVDGQTWGEGWGVGRCPILTTNERDDGTVTHFSSSFLLKQKAKKKRKTFLPRNRQGSHADLPGAGQPLH